VEGLKMGKDNDQLFDTIVREVQKLEPKIKVKIEVVGDHEYSNSFSITSDPVSILERMQDMTEDGELKITRVEIRDGCVL
jgi:hypothetical protein